MEHKIAYQFPSVDLCFGCNPQGVGLTAFATEDGFAVSFLHTKAIHQGFTGIIHGGILGTYLDEMAHFAALAAGEAPEMMTVEQTVTYRHPVKMEQDILIVSRLLRHEGRICEVEGRIYNPDGEVAAIGRTKYCTVAPGTLIRGTTHAVSKHYHPVQAPQVASFDWA